MNAANSQPPSHSASKRSGSSFTRIWADLSTQWKLLAGFGIIVALNMIVGTISLSKLKASQDRTDFLVEDSLLAARLAGDMDARVQKFRYLSRKLSTYRDKSQVPQIDAELVGIIARFKEALSGYKKTDLSGVEDVIDEIDAALPLVETAINTIRDTVSRGEYEAAEAMIDGKLVAPADRLDGAVLKLEELTNKIGNQVGADAHAATEGGRRIVVILLIASALISVFLALLIARSIVGPLSEAVSTLERVAEGRLDVTLNVNSADEVGQMAVALNSALGQIRTAMNEVGHNAHAVAEASEKLNSTAADMSEGAGNSARQLNEVASASNEVSRSVQTVAAALEEMNASIREISHGASEATQVASRAVDMSRSAKKAVSNLGDSSDEIGNVVQVIAEIAAQTNLLALNATIESARAGEAGKGFAVVAGEVKDLARETSKATDQIRERVTRIQTDTGQAISAIEQISEIVNQINDAQSQIASAVEEQTATTQEMSRSVAQGASGTGQIANDVTSIAQNARESKEGAEASSSAAQELSQMAAAVERSIGRFKY